MTKIWQLNENIFAKMSRKRVLILFSFLLSIQTAFSQNEKIDSIVKKIAAEKDDNARIELILVSFPNLAELNPTLDMQIAQKLLLQSQKNNDKITEAVALSGIGNDYRSFGNTSKSLEYNLKATALAEETGNEKLIAFTKITLALNYKDQADYPKAIKLNLSAEESFSKLKEYVLQTWALGNLSELYLYTDRIDSALMYAQRNYELSIRIHYNDNLSYIFGDLGSIHGSMGNSSLAISYFNMAIEEGLKSKSSKQLNYVYTGKAQYYHDLNNFDSSIVCAKKAIMVVKHTAFSNLIIKPSKLLFNIYRKINIDSAYKYSEMYRLANDSVFSAKTIQQTQLMKFEDQLRQQGLASEKIKAEEQRKQNLQMALIALGIIIFIILFLLLSRSFITNTRLIEFLGVMALLIVFEFLNLLLHPFLERVTNHTPIMMLLVLVFIAAILIPLHHRVEKWATALLIEKNKKIRLANAKKTIEKLEGKARRS
jgi:tetratricopeptide (TPR) repeat protein